ncbi:MAG TPA: SDR family NAD(P)-dependent oxidoreductase [Actinocrinis sp.]|nr:SDR family NAD(P)-dependent oxidoreductase [Actinocrinis sp.]
MSTSDTLRTPFTAQSTAAEVIAGVDLTGRRAIVTGAASGIGVETARALAAAGAQLTLAVRDLAAGERTAAELASATGNTQLTVARLDLADPDSVTEFTEAWQGPLHILVNNAGVMAAPETRTAQGWELQFATNHLGHFGLALGLFPALAAAGGARVVSVSSSAHLRAGVDFDDIHFVGRAYDPWIAYGQSKSANVLFAVEGAKRWADDGIVVNALMPGGIMTNLQRHVTMEELDRLRAQTPGAQPVWKTIEQGAATSVLLAASPVVDGVTGRYFEDCNEAAPHQPGTRNGVAAHAVDPEAAERLWADSSEALGR